MITIIVSSGIIASIFSVVVNFYIRTKDEKVRKKKMLYYPLYLACKLTIEVIKNYDSLGYTFSKKYFEDSAERLCEIVSNQGIIYLEGQDLYRFLELKKLVDKKVQLFNSSPWELLKSGFETDKDLKCAKIYAEKLLSKCQKEVKVDNLSDEWQCP